jgi:hypothetical protein
MSEQGNYTPGPYTYYAGGGIRDGAGRLIAALSYAGKRVSAKVTPEELNANGRLFAAAPELVEALCRLADRVEAIELPDGSTPDTCEARALLARIEGQE